MGACACVMIGLRYHRKMYGLWGVLEQRKYIEAYNCVGSTVVRSSVGFLIGVSPGGST